MSELDLAINNGKVINADRSGYINVGIKGERIVTLSNEPLQAKKIIDAKDRWVLPGVVDTHVHFALKQGQGDDATQTEDDYETGPIAAAIGGVTTFVDYAIAPRAQSPIEFLRGRMALADAGSCIDYSFHAGITNPDRALVGQLKNIVEMGIPSFKFFVTYRKWEFAVDLGFLWDVFNELRELNGIACIHSEDDELVEYLRAKHAGETDFINFGHTRPDFSEEISVYEMVTLAREARSMVHIVHLTTDKALRVIKQNQAQGVKVRTETCPHYLTFNDDVYRTPLGYLYTMTPPLRPAGNSEALWKGLADRSIGILTSDHNALGKALKEKHPAWQDVPPGLGGSEMSLTFLHSEGVAKGRISPERMVELLSSGPAQEFGIPDKGAVAVGMDADIVIFNPEEKRTIHFEDLATPGGFSIFEGMEMQGWPLQTISRGEVIVENRKFIGRAGRGCFIPRQINPEGWLEK
jgi:dihydropyrimidinase